MATQPQTNNIITLLNETVKQNIELISDNQVSVQESQVIIDDFDPSCRGLDTRIVSLVSSINTLKTDIVTIHSSARAVGCGTTVGVSTVFPDTAIDSSYYLSSSSYDSDEPYEVNNVVLTSSNVGFGTFVIYTKNDNQVTGLGSAYADIGSCYGGGCISGNCTNFLNQITTKQNQIVILQSELDNLVPSVNSIKTERVDYQIRRWADKNTIRSLTEENQRIAISLAVLTNDDYDSFI